MTRLLFSVLTLAVLAPGPLAAAPWLDDLAAAQKASAASGKPILVDVTGADWCPPCVQMEAEVFSRPEFLPAVQDGFVLLRLDFPKDSTQPERLRVQNQRFAERYPFDGFPTYFIMDAAGRLSGKQAGYVPGGVAGFATLATALAAQKPALTSLEASLAQAAPGVTRARAQDALFRQAEAWGIEFQYGDLPLKIIQEDKDGKAGLKARYQAYNAYHRLLASWASRGDDRQAAADFDKLADQALAWPDLAQQMLLSAALVRWNALEDEVGARDTLRKALALGPDTAVGMKAAGFLDQLP